MADGTTIDELVVKIGLDSAGFIAGQKQALESFKKTRDDATATGKELEARGAQGAEFFGKITAAALELGAVLIGAGSISSFLSKAIPQITALGQSAVLLGSSTKDLQGFQLWANQMGNVNVDAATGSILKLTQVMQGWKSGFDVPTDTHFLSAISLIGGTNSDTGITLFEKFAASIKAKGWTPQFANQIGGYLGFAPDMVATAVMNPDAAAGITAAGNQPGVLSKKQIDEVIAAGQAWRTLKNEVTGLGKELVADTVGVVALDKGLVQIGQDAKPVAKAFGDLWTTIKGLFDPADVNNFFSAFDHQLKALAALVRAVTDILKTMQADLHGDWKGATAAALDEAQAWKEYGLEQAATLGFGPNAGSPGATGGLPTESQNTPNGGAFGWLRANGYLGAGAAAGAGSGTLQDRERQLYAIFTAGGMTPIAAIAAISQGRAESGLNPFNINPNSAGKSHATGAFQWLKSRADAFEAWSGHDLLHSNIGEEGRFALHEAQNMPGFLAMLNAAPDEQTALAIWTKFFGLGGMHGKGALAVKEASTFAYDVRQGGRYLASTRAAVGAGSVVNIDTLNVNAGHVTDAQGIAKHIKKAIGGVAIQANSAYN